MPFQSKAPNGKPRLKAYEQNLDMQAPSAATTPNALPLLRKQTSLPSSGSFPFPPPTRSLVRGREFRASFSLPAGCFHSVTLMGIAGALQPKL